MLVALPEGVADVRGEWHLNTGSCRFGQPEEVKAINWLSLPLANAPPLPIAATIALEMIGPIPGTVITLRQLSSFFKADGFCRDRLPHHQSSKRRSTTLIGTRRKRND